MYALVGQYNTILNTTFKSSPANLISLGYDSHSKNTMPISTV